jgi:hypothetical protein
MPKKTHQRLDNQSDHQLCQQFDMQFDNPFHHQLDNQMSNRVCEVNPVDQGMIVRFHSFRDFFPFYLGEHQKPATKKLHFWGLNLAWVALIWVLWTGHWWGLILMPISGYGFAWYAHFFVEKNRPATFRYPLWSIMGDLYMYFLICKKRSFDW